MLHTHTLVVSLFLLLYLVKTFLLVAGKEETLRMVSVKTKWAERIISVLFLATGIYLYLYSGNITWMLHLKIGLVFASIPLAIIGFKRKKSFLAILSVIFLLAAYGLAEMNKKRATKLEKPALPVNASQLETGQALYSSYCQSCHGKDGDAGLSGAKNLRLSILTTDEKKKLIRNGKGAMPAYSQLSDSELDMLVQYTETLVNENR